MPHNSKTTKWNVKISSAELIDALKRAGIRDVPADASVSKISMGDGGAHIEFTKKEDDEDEPGGTV